MTNWYKPDAVKVKKCPFWETETGNCVTGDCMGWVMKHDSSFPGGLAGYCGMAVKHNPEKE